ncbi:MAG: hypothetical protein N2111_03090 [Candidatus Sumerlaeaceae bacterium]|nr:hypothetical protein [Candidatus Sumerlaeaceae bacterium]
MPLTRQEARTNLVALIQQQILRPAEHGELLLAIWHDIEDEAQDLHLIEVFESFQAPDGGGQAQVCFPGMANLWLPGLYHVTLFSREVFEGADPLASAPWTRLPEQLETGRAEILFVKAGAVRPQTALAKWLLSGQ